MCLLLLAVQTLREHKLILAANRDEYYDRPADSATFWKEAPYLLAGRDLRAGGTWLGITRKGRIAAISNYRDPASIKKNAPSRGRLVSDFLLGKESPVEYLNALAKEQDRYNGFNLIIGEKDRLYWYSNRDEAIHRLSPAIYGLSNRLLDTPWPKVTRSKDALARLLSKQQDPSPEALFRILLDRATADDERLPDTGVGIEWERMLSPIFVVSPTYGTRSSTLIFIDHNDHVTFIERTFNSNPDHPTFVKYLFQIENA